MQNQKSTLTSWNESIELKRGMLSAMEDAKPPYKQENYILKRLNLNCRTYLFRNILITSLADERKCQKKNICTPVAERAQPVIVLLAWIYAGKGSIRMML